MARHPEWDPFQELAAVQKRMNKLFEAALARSEYGADGGIGPWTPVADTYETETAYHVLVELPGLRQDDIDVRVERDELVVEGERPVDREQPGEHFHRVERSYGRFARRFRLPSTVDRQSIRASYRNGVLEISLGKRESGEPKAIRVSIR